jgi:F-type H+-transporting ATPase subunit a
VKVESNKYAYIPLFLLLVFIGVMESFSILFIRPVALSLRLYGNIFGGETMLTMAMSQKSVVMAILLSLPGFFFETIVCLLQAFVFAMLSVAFVGTMCTHSDEEHGH